MRVRTLLRFGRQPAGAASGTGQRLVGGGLCIACGAMHAAEGCVGTLAFELNAPLWGCAAPSTATPVQEARHECGTAAALTNTPVLIPTNTPALAGAGDLLLQMYS